MSDSNQEPQDFQQSPYSGNQSSYNNQGENGNTTTPPNPNGGQQQYNNNESFNSNQQEPKPNNNLVLAIIATVLSFCSCCGYGGCLGIILGIIAIVFATQVDSKYRAGDFFGAQKSANNAKMLSYAALATVAISIIVIIVGLATTDWSEFTRQYQEILDQVQ